MQQVSAIPVKWRRASLAFEQHIRRGEELLCKGVITRIRRRIFSTSTTPVPKRVVQELLRYYTRTPDRPEGYGLDTPFELPAEIRSVTVGAERVTVTQ